MNNGKVVEGEEQNSCEQCGIRIARALLCYRRSPPVRHKAVVCESNMTALYGKQLSIFQVESAIPQSRKVILTALYRDTVLFRPSNWGTLECSTSLGPNISHIYIVL